MEKVEKVRHSSGTEAAGEIMGHAQEQIALLQHLVSSAQRCSLTV